jgi:predicted metal-binding protein
MTTLFVCITCRARDEGPAPERPRPGLRLFAALSRSAAALGGEIAVVPVQCLANCTRACTVAVSGAGKWSYVVGALDPDRDAPDVIAFARLHHADAAGLPPWRERPEHVRRNTVARVPPLPSSLSPQPETAAR